MEIQSVYKEIYKEALLTQKFSVGHLYHTINHTNIDMSGCYKIFYMLSGHKKFHIDNQVYDVKPGDLYLINQREYHYFSNVDQEESQERIVCFIYPEYLKSLCTDITDLTSCFHLDSNLRHKCVLKDQEQVQFLNYIQKLSGADNFGDDILSFSVFLELMVFINRIVNSRKSTEVTNVVMKNVQSHQIREILSYINSHITEELSIDIIANHFYISSSYLCRIFKNATGTTIHRYITAKRILLAKDLLAEGHTCMEVCFLSGFKDYNGFWKSFVKAVGVSPAKYEQFYLG